MTFLFPFIDIVMILQSKSGKSKVVCARMSNSKEAKNKNFLEVLFEMTIKTQTKD